MNISLFALMKTGTIVEKIPLLGGIIRALWRAYYARKPFETSELYWIQRYEMGKLSGAGSYGEFAELKAHFLNNFVKENTISTVIEFGCGDGSQLRLAEYPHYIGYDVSPVAISLCREMFVGDNSKKFRLMSDYGGEKAVLSLSLDVVYHLVENKTFESYMNTLFASSNRWVVIYSTNIEQRERCDPHVRHRKFTEWVETNSPEWTLTQHVPNSLPNALTDFYIYKRA